MELKLKRRNKLKGNRLKKYQQLCNANAALKLFKAKNKT